MTFKHFCDLVDSSGFLFYIDNEKETIRITFPDEPTIYFHFMSSTIRGVSFVHDKISPNLVGKALLFCNKWNEERYIPKIYLDSDNNFVLEYIIQHSNPDPDDEWVIRNFILKFIDAREDAIEEIEEEFD